MQEIAAKTVFSGVLTRLVEKFENSNPIKQNNVGVIKNYVYVEQRRIIA